ncbi:aldose epimerase family protein [Litorilituus lipolyticus]|uniref:Aldose 1-epimerase n=1 Tax=Litorilituus lipolyticus TaxID=2491017 RepID=A0A502KQY0_9GAMM|nr:aldose epimerase family protein [Litorilituus lipolyticus]TPH13896.1 galactose mutarotase [Litorilituus lipolyticus]
MMKKYQVSDGMGLTVTVIPKGATITSICFQNKELTLGYSDINDYLSDDFYLGATVGRYANRIKNGKFSLDEHTHQLSVNQLPHCLHGGENNFSKRLWSVTEITDSEIELHIISEDGDQGFPGTLEVWHRIRVSNNKVYLSYRAFSDKDTVVNLTNHCYFNLEENSLSINEHQLKIEAEAFLPIDENGIPLIKQSLSEHKAFDYSEFKLIEHSLCSDHEQIKIANGIDHCFTLNVQHQHQHQHALELAAQLISPKSQLKLSVYTTLPGLQVYTGNYLSDPFLPKQGICLEAQFWPDSPNRAEFPSVKLCAGEEYFHEIIYEISRL